MTTEPSPSLEIERKYDVDAGAPLPDWAALPGVARVGEPEPRDLDARYLDTADGRLAAARSALRRRTGGPDEGWHLKQATPEGKLETHWPLGEGDGDAGDVSTTSTTADADAPTLPAAVIEGVAGLAEPPFVVLARIRNARVAYALYNAAGGVVAEFVDDHVTALDVRRGISSSWREWELEFGPAAPAEAPQRAALFAAADALVTAAGGRVAASESKLGRALGV
ncbi:CYTH domain-containing protein [Microbacterium aurum]